MRQSLALAARLLLIPSTARANIARNLFMDHVSEHRTTKHELNVRPWNQHVCQELIPGDLWRRRKMSLQGHYYQLKIELQDQIEQFVNTRSTCQG